MKNFPIIDKATEREYWISRSVAVVVAIFVEDSVLVVQRGNGTPDPEYVGSYCIPCGYVDFDETIIQAAQREVMEETGLMFSTFEFRLISINDNPYSDKRQNITFRYVIKSLSSKKELENKFTTKNSEKDEVSSIKFIKIDELDNYKLAFNHNVLIKELYEQTKK